MKVCEICGADFKPKGRQRACNSCKEGISDAMRKEGLQAEDASETTKPERSLKPVRPIERFGRNRMVMPGQMGVRIIRRGN